MRNSERRKTSFNVKMGGVPTWIFLLTATSLLTQYASASEPRVVCYYTNWSVYRPGTARFNPQNINPYLCTHLIYAFGGFTKDNTLKPFDKYQDIEKGGYAKFTGLKTYNNRLKTMLAIGGWNEGSSRFSPMVASRERRKEFVRNAIKFLRQNRFDGLDLDWEYPAFRDGGKPKDRDNYARLVRELREEFEREASKTGKPRLLLTMAVPAGIEYIQKGFDVKALNEHLDWMNLLSYDYHSAFEPAVNHHAPLFPLEEPNEYSVDNELNIDYTIQYYLENGADADKLVLGIPTYGRSYTLFNPDATELGAPADGPGEQGDATREKGYLAYYEICESLLEKPKKKKSIKADDEDDEEEEDEPEEEDLPWTVVQPNPSAMGPVAYRGNQWVGYDDIDIVKKKAEYVAEKRLGGIMFWSIDNDDFRGKCHGKPYPLIEAAKEAYISKLGITDNAITSERQSSSSRRRSRPSSTSAPASTRRSAAAATPAWTSTTPEPPTTPDPGSDFKCTDEGFYPHPRDCKKYFWCLDSGPSNLGIVAHQFTCPSGLFFNKLADSCDFARNVLCKKPAEVSSTTTAKPASSTNQPRASTTSRPAAATTTRRPNKLTSKSSVYFRTTTTTVRPVVDDDEVYEDEIIEDAEAADVDSEDPKVIKELIDLIKKAGGVEQLERHLKLSGSDAPPAAGTTTPLPIPKKLYQKVLDHARQAGKGNLLDRYNSVSRDTSSQAGKGGEGGKSGQNSRRGPQNEGIESIPEASNLRRERPQYTTINRGRPAATSEEPSEREAAEAAAGEEPDAQAQAPAARSAPAPAKPPPQYVNIRRARPTTQPATDGDDDAARNALFERNEATFVSTASEYPPSQSSRHHTPEYVTIRRSRPTTEQPTTAKYQTIERERPIYEEEDEDEETPAPATPQYSTLKRTRGTTPSEPLTSPAPTTVLAVQISSLLNSPVTTEPQPSTQSTEPRESDLEPSASPTLEPVPPTTVTEPTTTTILAPSSTAAPRRAILKRVRSTTTTTTSSPTSAVPQVSSVRNYNIIRRRRPNEISSDLEEPEGSLRKIRSTTPDSRETSGNVQPNGELGFVPRGSRNRFNRTIGTSIDSVSSAARTPLYRGRFRPTLNRDDLSSLTPIDHENPDTIPLERNAPQPEGKFRPRTRPVTPSDTAPDTEASAATVEIRRPDFIPRGRSRFTVTSSTERPDSLVDVSTESPKQERKPAFSRFTPRPFSRFGSTTTTVSEVSVSEDIPIVTEGDIASATPRSPVRLPFGRTRAPNPRSGVLQARKVSPLLRRGSSTTESLVEAKYEEIEDETENKTDDIHLSESTIEEKEHEEAINEGHQEVTRRRIVIKKIITNPISTDVEQPSNSETDIVPTSENDINISSVTPSDDFKIIGDEEGRQKIIKIIRRRPTSTSPSVITDSVTEISPAQNVSSAPNRVRKIIRKKIIPYLAKPEIELDKRIENDNSQHTDNVSLESNYGEKARPIVFSVKSVIHDLENISLSQKTEVSTSQAIVEELTTENFINISQGEQVLQKVTIFPDTSSESPVKGFEINESPDITESTNAVESTEPITKSTEAISSTSVKSKFERTQYRPPKRLFTPSTEASVAPSSRTYSRKYNGAVYTSPLIPDREVTERSRPAVVTRRPLFTSKPFLRKPFTARTTKKVEEEYNDEEFEEESVEEDETPLVFVPDNQLFSRGSKENEDSIDLENNDDVEEDLVEEEEKVIKPSSRRPLFRPKTINSNTFRTSTSTTEIPKRTFSGSQNRTKTYNKSIFSRPSSNDTKKRTQNVPVGYNAQTTVEESKEGLNLVNKENYSNHTSNEDNFITTTFSNVEFYESTTDDDYLTDKIIDNFTDVNTSLNTHIEDTSTNTDPNLSTVTEPMEVYTNTDDYLESKEETQETLSTDNPTTVAQHIFSETLQTNFDSQTTVSSDPTYHDNTDQRKDKLETTTVIPETTSFIQTHFDKLFSISRVVEVSSKQDKHRLNRNNESRLVETGQIMQEKKPTVDKIGEVSRFTLIKIVKDDIPIYLTKLGHAYPVDNPPDNPIRIDEGRNARALVNFTDAGRENLVASESVNEAYRHVNKLGTTEIHMNKGNPLLELLKRDHFETHNNEEDTTEKSQSYSPYPVQWQFVPAAYENDYTKEKLNKEAKSFKVITPRSYKTDPSTIALEGLFRTENPLLLSSSKVLQDISQSSINNQPFVVYAAPRLIDQGPTNFVKLQVLQPESGRSVKTYVRGQELSGASDRTTVKYPVSISILSTNAEKDDNKGTTIMTDSIASTTKMVEYLTTVAETTTIFASDFTTETDYKTTTKMAETVTEPEVTTPKPIVSSDSLADNAKKRPKLTFPRRPNFRNNNITRINISPLPNQVTTPRATKKTNHTILTSNVKTNKSTGFNPNKSRYSANRSQNVPVDARGSKKTSPAGFLQKQNSTDFVRVQPASSDSSRKLYFKPIRPNLLRPSFVPRRASTSTEATTQQTTTRRSFPRRRPTAAALTRDPEEVTMASSSRDAAEATTVKSRVRGASKFDKKRAPAPKVTAGKSDPAAEGFRAKKRPSFLEESASQSTGAVRRPTRTYVRRRPGGAGGANATSTAAPDTTTTQKTSTEGTRRPFRVVGRRRTTAGSTVATATGEAATVAPAAGTAATGAPAAGSAATVSGTETPSHDLAVQESMEKESNDSPSEPKRPLKKTVKIQRRPLSSRQPPPSPATTTTTTEEPKKREGKKYSASFKQNQLDEAIRQKSGEVDESTEPLEELSVDTAIAIAAHQLLGAPLPSTPTYDDETDYSPSKRTPGASTKAYRPPSTEAYTGYSNSKDYSGRVSYPTGFTTPSPTFSIQSSTPRNAGISSSSPSYSRGSTLIGSSLGYTRGATVESSSPTVYSRGSSSSLTGSSPAYSRGSTVESSNPPVYSRASAVSVQSSPSPVYLGGSSTYVPSLNRYLGTTNKYVSIPIDDFGYSTDGYTGGIGQEPAYFTREYLMESPQTRKYETDYQYLTTETPLRITKRPSAFRRISTTVGPSSRGNSILPSVTPQPRRSPSKVHVYDKLPKNQVTYRPVLNYDYYDDGDEKLLDRYPEANKVVVHDNGNIECLDMGNFPHPASCRKFVSCARMESGALVGWQYVCPQGLSYDPVGGMCNWSAGLGCNES